MQAISLHKSNLRPWGTGDLSPFCIKLETYLRVKQWPYKLRGASMTKAPKGKVPYVQIGDEVMGDSGLIIARLEAESGNELTSWLSPLQRAQDHLVRRTMEEGYYFVGLYLRWVKDAGFVVVAPEFRKFIPKAAAWAVIPMIRKKVRSAAHAQGIGRHSEAEVNQFGIADMTAIATLLGDKPFMLGDKLALCDITVFAFLESLLGPPIDSELKTFVLAQQNLIAFRQRMRAAYWSDLA
ncbi:MAG: glutathione S-transferase family protein [Myxococcales bacterium]|nr:glutathione S-transferase family protein [Myxococcales bacterium]